MNKPKEYIVKVKNPANVDSLISELKAWNVKVSDVSKVGFIGFTAAMGTLISKWFKDDSRIESMEPVEYFELHEAQIVSNPNLWFLDRIDQQSLPLSGLYTYLNDGTGATIYTIDSGISPYHVELAGKVTAINDPNQPGVVFDPVMDQRIYDQNLSGYDMSLRGVDEIGHGTFIAGLLVSNSYGVVKNALVRSAKIFSQGSVSSGRILAGLNAIKQDYLALNKPPSVLNISFGGSTTPLVLNATNNTPIPSSSFYINGNLVTLSQGTVNEIVLKINNLHLSGITASSNGGYLAITMDSIGSIIINDAANNPMTTMGIPSGTYQNAPTLVEQAINDLIQNGMHVVISAGNSNTDAKFITPARLSINSPSISVGSIDEHDNLAMFTARTDMELPLGLTSYSTLANSAAIGSCYGPAIQVYAPGTSMESTWIKSYNIQSAINDEVMIASGTSFSAPLVAGAIAMMLQSDPTLTPAGGKNQIQTIASMSPIGNLPSGSNNFILNIPNPDNNIKWVSYGPFPEIQQYIFTTLTLLAQGLRGVDAYYSVDQGTLPPGFSLNSQTGIISGIVTDPAALGNYIAIIRAADGYGYSDQAISIVIIEGTAPPAWITPTNLGSIPEGDLINITLSAHNQTGSQPIEFSVINHLPYGWTLTDDQIIGMAPIATNGNFNVVFSINAWDGISYAAREFTLTILQDSSYLPTNEPVWDTPTGIIAEVVAGAVDNNNNPIPVSIQLLAHDLGNGPEPLTYNLQITDGDGSSFGPFGLLPTGLTLDSTTGIISGVIPVDAVATETPFSFAVYLSDGANVVSNYFTILVTGSAAYVPPIWDAPFGNLGTYNLNDPVAIQLHAHDVNGSNIVFIYQMGQLPNGITFHQDGSITGTVMSNTDTLYVFTVLASNGELVTPMTFTIQGIKTNQAPVWSTTADLGSFNEGQFINIHLGANDQDGDLLEFYSSDLPSNLYITDSYLRGTLPAVDSNTVLSFTITVSDILSNTPDTALTTDKLFTLTVIDGALNTNLPPVWMTQEGLLPPGSSGQQYITSVIATDPEGAAVFYQIVDGSLPPQISLDPFTGTLSGTIDQISQDTGFDFVISASDGVNVVTRAFSISVSSIQLSLPPVWITGSDLGSVVDGTVVRIMVVANDPQGYAILYSLINGTLPPGLLFNIETGEIAGVPSILVPQFTYQFTIRATDIVGNSTDQQFSITVVKVANAVPVWDTPSGQLSDASGKTEFHTDDYVSIQLVAHDPDSSPLPLSYSIGVGYSLPAGLTMSTGGLITGFIGTVLTAENFGFIINVSDGQDVTPREFIITLNPAPSYTGTTTDLYVPIDAGFNKILRQWNSSTLIPDNMLFISDSIYGRQQDFNIFVAGNLHLTDKNELQDVLGIHHRRFGGTMGIPTYAKGNDKYGNPLYEVIYIPIIDPEKGSDFNIATQNSLTYVSENFDNIRTEIKAIGNNEVLPSWMTAPQTTAGSILGYTPAIVLAYVQPGYGLPLTQTMTQIINQTNFTRQETTFDNHVYLAERVNPTVIAGDQMSVDGILVTFSGGDVFSIRNDIQAALIAAGNTLIKVDLSDSVEFRTSNNNLSPVFGYSIMLSYSKDYMTLLDITGTPMDQIGFFNTTHIQTTFDGQLVHFDYALILDQKQNIQGPGLTFVGKKLLFDRYVAKTSINDEYQIKWSTDLENQFYDGLTKEFYSKNLPMFVTQPGELGPIGVNQEAAIQLVTKHHFSNQTVEYSIIFGNLPDGFVLNSNTGVITGTAGPSPSTWFFTVRANDPFGNFYDRGFTISIV